jgi:hypothetical protein
MTWQLDMERQTKHERIEKTLYPPAEVDVCG